MIPGSLDGFDTCLKEAWGHYRQKVKKLGKHSFAAWIAYQTIKGTLTTSLIWIPLAYHYLHG